MDSELNKKRALTRIFHVIDIRKLNKIDFETFICTFALFTKGSFDDLAKCKLFILT